MATLQEFVTRELGYQCANLKCGKIVLAVSPWRDDAPEGYYTSIRRVTENHNHKMTDELFLCSKECLLELVTFQINTYAQETIPIARKKKRGW